MTPVQVRWVAQQTVLDGTNKQISLYCETGVRSRKYHRKSKVGCKLCKRRRVKCDENRPACSRCTSRRLVCEYSNSEDESKAPKHATSSSYHNEALVSLDKQALLSQGVQTEILSSINATNATCGDLNLTGLVSYTKRYAIEGMQHFISFSGPWLKTRCCQRIMQDNALRLALQAPYVLHAVLAISSAHLATLKEDSSGYWTASAISFQHSLRLYSSAVNDHLHESDADALFFAALLHIMLAFVYAPFATTGLHIAPGTAPGWIASTRGTHALFKIPELRHKVSQGIWRDPVEEYETWYTNAKRVASPRQPSREVLLLENLCVSGGSRKIAMYTELIEKLKLLPSENSRCEDINGFMSFFGRSSQEFIQDLKAQDERALIVLGCWCSMLNKTQQWWAVPASKSESPRIIQHFQGHRDLRIHALLESFAA